MQANGTGAKVGFVSIFLGALCAECIPLLAMLVGIGAAGLAWDWKKGHVSGKKKKAQHGGNHAGQKEISTLYKPNITQRREDVKCAN